MDINQSEKIPFTDTKYGKYINLYKYTQYGRITKIDDEYIHAGMVDEIMDGHMYMFKKDEYIDSSNLYEGQEIVESCYVCKTDAFSDSVIGICGKKEYENPIRDSQMLPKGWKHEPYYTVSVKRGTLKYRFYWHMEPDDAPNTKYELDDRAISSFTALYTPAKDSRIVELTFTITLPDDKIETRKAIVNEDEYDKYMAENEKKKAIR